MLVLSMNSKRQRRPNVRLGEIGDVSAAFACGISRKTRKNFEQSRWKRHFLSPKESEYNPAWGVSQQIQSHFTSSDPGVSPRVSAGMQQSGANTSPNSSKLAFELASTDEILADKPELNFGTVTRKCRLMRRQKRCRKGNNSIFSGGWNGKISPETSSESGKNRNLKEVNGFTSNAWFDLYHANASKDCSDHDTSGSRKEDCDGDIEELTFNMQTQKTSNDLLNEDACYEVNNASKDFSDHDTSSTGKEDCDDDIEELAFNVQTQRTSGVLLNEDACYEVNNTFLHSFGGFDKIKIGHTCVNSVKKWLEELGFGKYAGVFEIHEVDEEALPLLTFEDLKEMGVLAVGPRRKLYAAIQQLRGG